MQRPNGVEAAARGRFRVYPLTTVDEAIALLTGRAAGQPDASGAFPPDSVNGRVAARLSELARARQEFSDKHSGKHDAEDES